MTLHVERSGQGTDLVLLHGWALHGGAWSEALPSLARRFRVHAIDLPGHGRSAAEPVGTLDAAADAVARLAPEGAILCGWSLGGLVAQRAALRHGARVRALALVASTPCFARRPDWPHAMAVETLEDFARGLAHDRDETLRRFVRLNALHGAHGREAIRAFTARLAERGAPDAAALGATLAWLRDADLRSDAGAIALPALVIHGERDALVPVEAGRWLARRLPHARLHEIADAAHLPFFTHREAFVNALETLVG